MTPSLDDLYKSCLDIIEESGKIILSAWDKPRSITHKAKTDLVTETDIAVQNFLQKELARLLPEAAFVGEENSGVKPDPAHGLCWIVDPVDGTTNFVHRFPMVATSIGLWENGKPLLGFVNAPVMGELFSAAKGMGSFCNGKVIKASGIANLQDALVATGFPYNIEPELPDILRRLANVLPATQGLRRPGSAALDLCYVACGRLDAFFENTLKPWDIAGGITILLEAGGTVSNFENSQYQFGQALLASNGLVHNALAALL